MGCLICSAEPTVKSHIIPRALFHAMKRDGHQLVGGRGDGPGYRVLQAGDWDDRLLCSRHEAALGEADRYGVAFCLEAKRQSDMGKHYYDVANPRPDLLVAFASACVWRYAASRSNGRPERALGPYAGKIQRALFEQGDFSPFLLVSRHAYEIEPGQIMNMGVLPHLYHEEGIRFWRFIVLGLIFDLKLDNRATPPPMAILGVNDQNLIRLSDDFPQKVMRVPGFARSLIRLATPPGKGRPG